MLFVTIWWVVDAHKWFKGPKVHSPPQILRKHFSVADGYVLQVNIEHRMLGRERNVIDGEEVNGSGDSSSGSSRDQINDKKAADLA